MQNAAEIISLIISFLLSNTSPEHRAADYCNTESEVKYCYYKGESKHVVYFLHGFGNELQSWGRNIVTKKVEEYWKQGKYDRPHVVTVSFDPFWLFHEKENSAQKLNNFVTQFEKTILKRKIKSRTLYGDSMGGYNALQWLKVSPTLFDRLALICPAISRSMIEDKAEEYSGLKWLSPLADKLFYNEKFNSPDQYKKIIKTIKKAGKLKSIYLAMSPIDELGFYPGNRFLKRLIEANDFKNFIWEEEHMHHCQLDSFTLAEQLAN